MKKFYKISIVSFIGFCIGMGTIFYSNQLDSSNTIEIPSMNLPFNMFIAGTGIVESRNKNITVGSSVSGVVKNIYVQSGDKIQKGELLFEIDDTFFRSDVLIAEAEIKIAKAKFMSAKRYFELIKNFKKALPQMVTKPKYLKAQNYFYEAKENLEASKIKWNALKDQLKCCKIYSPIDGVVLKSEINKGDFFNKNSKALIIGNEYLNVRVSINEYDIFKFKSNTKTVAYIRGNNKEKIDLIYSYIIPYVVPKINITGRSTERTDIRVLQVIYRIKNTKNVPLYVGEELDIFIQIPEQE